jgi:hypothetical protein
MLCWHCPTARSRRTAEPPRRLVTETLDLVCPSCGRTLRIAAEHAGKQVRCPACQQISAAPLGPDQLSKVEAGVSAAAPEAAPQWHVRTPEGAAYGPIAWTELLSWVAEGRVAADCELASSADGPWQQADALLPALKVAPATPQPVQPHPYSLHPSAAVPALNPSPFAGAAYPGASPGTPGGLAPHRGALVLIFGLLGFVVGCPVFSALAWIFGSRDLREMRLGRMDRQGEGITLVGMVLGMILSILWLVTSLILLTIALIAIAAQF